MAMGTVNSISTELRHRTAVRAARDEVLKLHRNLNVFDEMSEISEMNRNAGEKMVPVSCDTSKLLRDSQKLETETGGAFKISTLPASRMWRKACAEDRTPTSKEMRAARKSIQNEALIIDETGRKAGLKRHGQGIDLGGIAKGYAADAAVRILQGYGVKEAVLNFGGTVVAHGVTANVGIRNPFDQEKEIGYICIKDKAVVTSGIYERGGTIRGERYHHVIDPRTCRPSESELVSVTLVGNGAKLLDALATAVLVLGAKEGYGIVRKYGFDAVFVDKNGDVKVTNGLREDLIMR